jgi:hypothetical protein
MVFTKNVLYFLVSHIALHGFHEETNISVLAMDARAPNTAETIKSGLAPQRARGL